MTKYAVIVVLGAVSYGALTSFAKIAYGEGYTAAEITFAQASLGALTLFVLAFVKKSRTRKWRLAFSWKLLLAGTSMGLSAYCFYLSVNYIPVSLAIVLLMQVSWMSTLLEWLVFKKRPGRAAIISTILIILGSALASNLLATKRLEFSLKGILLALSAAFVYALYVLFTSKLENKIPMLEKSALMMTGSALMILAVNFPSIIASTHLDMGLLQWGLFLALFGTVIPPICFTVGMPKIGPGWSAVLLTLELPSVVLCAHFILKEQVNLMQITGMLVMAGAIIYLNLSKVKAEKKEASQQKKQSLRVGQLQKV